MLGGRGFFVAKGGVSKEGGREGKKAEGNKRGGEELPFEHEDDVRVAGDVRVHGDGEDEVVVFAVEVVEVVAPELLDGLGVHPAVGLGGAFDEHLLFARSGLISASVFPFAGFVRVGPGGGREYGP